MASELRVNTLKDASGNNSVATSTVAQGSAKAWINLNGTTPTARDSFNCTLSVDNGSGDYTFAITSTMDNSDYSFTIGHRGAADNDTDDTPSLKSGTSATDSSIRIICNNQSLGSLRDVDYLCMAIHGDLT